MAITQETRINSPEAMMIGNAQLMDEVFNDGKMTAAEKMKVFSMGIRMQVILSRDQAARRAELFKYGIKANDSIKQLIFNPLEEPASEQTEEKAA